MKEAVETISLINFFYYSLQIQFVMVMVHAFQLLFKNDCNFPIAFSYFIGAHAVMFYFLFSGFYKSTYTAKEGKSKQKVKVEDSQGAAAEETNKLMVNGNGSAKKHYENNNGTTRQRTPFVGANGWICQPVHIN